MKNELYGSGIDVDIYEDSINVIHGNKEKAIKYCESKGCEFTDNIKLSLCDGFCAKNDNQSNFVFIKNINDKNVVCHELMHAILNITNARGIVIDDRNGYQESTCYLVGYVMGRVLSMKNKEWFIYKKNDWREQK